MSQHLCGDQRTALWSPFSVFIFTRVWELNTGPWICTPSAFTHCTVSLAPCLTSKTFFLHVKHVELPAQMLVDGTKPALMAGMAAGTFTECSSCVPTTRASAVISTTPCLGGHCSPLTAENWKRRGISDDKGST